MQPQHEDPMYGWLTANQQIEGSETWRLVGVWQRAAITNGLAIQIEEVWEKWYAHSAPIPDLVECAALYGYSRLLIQGWKQLPIELSSDQAEAWSEWGLGASLLEFRERQAGIAGGFLELAGRNPEVTSYTLQHQLNDKLAELTRLADLPLEDYTPQFTEAALTTRFEAEGYSGELLKEIVETEMVEEGAFYEPPLLDRPFHLYEQLTCFTYVLPKFRMFAITETDEELNLPNKQLYEALMDGIDLNRLLARLGDADEKLCRILQHLARHNYFKLDQDTAPEGFWRRHWKLETQTQHQQNRERGHKPQRGNSGKPGRNHSRGKQSRPRGGKPQPGKRSE